MNGEKSIPNGWEPYTYSLTGEYTGLIVPKEGVSFEATEKLQEGVTSRPAR